MARRIEVFSAIPIRALEAGPPWWWRIVVGIALGIAGVSYHWE